MECDAAEVDRKLWMNAAAQGWRVVEAYGGGGASGNWRYLAPGGEPAFKTRKEAFALLVMSPEFQRR